ncbi:MAG TPA: hypothetical protein VMG63_21370 [Terriglobia bacterium]|nr:hypothetical protein [Terriglobia bacterium]
MAPSPPSQFLSATDLHPDTLRRGYLHAEDLHQLADHHYSRQLFGHHYLHGGFHLERALERCDLAGGRGHCRHSSSRPEYRGSSHLGGDRRSFNPNLLAIPFIGPFLALAVDVILAAIGIAGLLGFLGPLLTPFVSGLTFNMRWSPNPNRDGKPQVSSSPLSTVLTIRAKGKPDVR